MNNKKLPIGYYLKQADNLLTEGINKIHLEFGLTRTDWQILDSIHETDSTSKASLFVKMKDFIDARLVEEIVASLKKRDIVSGKETFSLTENGENLYRACLSNQTAFRNRTMAGISEEEYLQVVGTLEKMINNLSSPLMQ